jgi:di/tricarboxylate transporter
MVASVLIGAFVSNTAATAFFLPIVVGLARRARLSPARLLMPLGFASILASSITLIGTSTNIVISGMMANHGLQPIGMFELTPAGLAIAAIGLAYMLLVGRHLVPDRTPPDETQDLSTGLFITEVLIPEGSPLAGQTLQDAGLGRDLDLKVLRITRERKGPRRGTRYVPPRALAELQERDVLLVEGARESILRIKEITGISITGDAALTDADLEDEDATLAEVIVLPGSPLIGRTLAGLDFRERYELQILAINRHGRPLTRKMSRVRLRTADALVVQGSRRQIETLARQGLFRILSSAEGERPRGRRAILATAIFACTLAAATFNLFSLPVAMLLGALLVLATRCITPEEAYSRVNWTVLILIASMLGLGTAMETTGAARFLAGQIVGLAGNARPVWLLSAFFGLTVLLTQPMSNQAAAAVVLPVAMQTAAQLGLNPRSFAITIALAASCSFLTPLEPACLLIYGPGRYRFTDFPRVGLLLSLLIYLVAITLVPLLWPV